ncbi:hypothetical protein GCM10009764_61790 [Nocardia ninae]|uniref:Uncharacterized protein n=1 Tax=Nocardia ninae NBRC 108245 TaxID=1210091 RepID=A0A511M881_9NOCA|nr:hypothetical protein NN4_13280 [Nocardia ninae NBRC 108245]
MGFAATPDRVESAAEKRGYDAGEARGEGGNDGGEERCEHVLPFVSCVFKPPGQFSCGRSDAESEMSVPRYENSRWREQPGWASNADHAENRQWQASIVSSLPEYVRMEESPIDF